MTSIYEIVGDANGNPLVENDFRAWQAAIESGDHDLARQIELDAAITAAAIKRGYVSVPRDGLPMPIISDRLTSQPENLEV